MIALAAAERLYKSLKKRGLFFSRALILGGGAIGKAVQNRLSTDMDIKIAEDNYKISQENLENTKKQTEINTLSTTNNLDAL